MPTATSSFRPTWEVPEGTPLSPCSPTPPATSTWRARPPRCRLFGDARRHRRIWNRHLHILAGLRDSTDRHYFIGRRNSVGNANRSGDVHFHGAGHQHPRHRSRQHPAAHRNAVFHGGRFGAFPHHRRQPGQRYGGCSLFGDAPGLRRIWHRHLHIFAGLWDSATRYDVVRWRNPVGHANGGGDVHLHGRGHQRSDRPATHRDTVFHHHGGRCTCATAHDFRSAGYTHAGHTARLGRERWQQLSD